MTQYDRCIFRRASRGDRKEPILVSGDTIEEVRRRGRLVESPGFMKPAGRILKSDITGEFYQWWELKEGNGEGGVYEPGEPSDRS